MKKKTKRLSFAAVAVIIVCAVMVTTALAVGFGMHEAFIDFFNIGDKEIGLVESAAAAPEASATDNGVTIDVIQSLTDGKGLYLILEITAEDSSVIKEIDTDNMYNLTDYQIPVQETDTFAGASWRFEEISRDENKLTTIMTFDSGAPIVEGAIELHFSDFGSHVLGEQISEYVYENEFVKVLEGQWDLSWELSFENTRKEIEVQIPINIDGKQGTISEVNISPISACVCVIVDVDLVMSIWDYSVDVNFKDGSSLTYSDFSSLGAVSSYRWAWVKDTFDDDDPLIEFQLYSRFGQIINPDDVESVTVGDITIPIE